MTAHTVQNNMAEFSDLYILGDDFDAILSILEEENDLENHFADSADEKRYINDTLARMPIAAAAAVFLTTLNSLHSSLTFTMELTAVNEISFIGIIEIVKNGAKLETQVTPPQSQR
ncbi:hypothetical protein AWC38_SpisGene13903 [Stylophora pistillata]|uniref:Uncharacterized protein n=1 Tax=Stylophora pistillata TaxID=50429 RepID=A0A2B4RT45_STYPI|nr:hypothetical protein AWC38_SpisGene13903 [Stylophora pistillata]